MKETVRSPGSATIINAIATGFGSAFGIGLNITTTAKIINSGIKTRSDVNASPDLMEFCVKEIIDYYNYLINTNVINKNDNAKNNANMPNSKDNINLDDIGFSINTKSNLSRSSGLSSSSATSNGIVKAVAQLLSEELCLKPLSDIEIINLAIDASLKAKVTITGAFDDATASYFGGISVTNNRERKIIIKEPFSINNSINVSDNIYDNNLVNNLANSSDSSLVNSQDNSSVNNSVNSSVNNSISNEIDDSYNRVLVYMPKTHAKTSDANLANMKLIAPFVETAFKKAREKKYFEALTLNGILYCTALDFNPKIALDALNEGALASGLSGTGSSFVAIVNSENIDNIKDIWSIYDGNVIETDFDNTGCVFIRS